MAGIGFALRQSLARRTFLGTGKTYLAAAVISSGPWLLSVATLLAISLFATNVEERERNLLFASIMYSFALSLIGVGPIQMTVTRYLADIVYVGDTRNVGSSYVGTTSLVLAVLSCPVTVLCLTLTETSLPFRLAMLALFVGAVGTWLALIYLSMARDYPSIVRAFLVGYGLGALCAVLSGPTHGLTGYLVGFALGQLTVFGMLSFIVVDQFVISGLGHFAAFSYPRRYPSLIVAGFTYNVAIWADKLVFWYAPTGITLSGYLHISPRYDVAVFLSSLVAVPASIVFLVQVETSFYLEFGGDGPRK